MALSNLLTLLDRNIEIFNAKKILFLGEIDDENLLHIAKVGLKATLLVDNFLTASKMAGLFMQDLNPKSPAVCRYKHLEIIFGSRQEALELIDADYDLICLLLTKTKGISETLLASFQSKFQDGASILIAGANDAGGKSANKLLSTCSEIIKIDSARKCTLFGATYYKDKAFPKPKKTQNLSLSFSFNGNHLLLNQDEYTLDLLQDLTVFSPQTLDEGTALLLSAIDCSFIQHKSVLDLCCGCGVVGIALASIHAQVTFCDVSAQALALTSQNLSRHNLQGDIIASNFLEKVGKFDLIVVNPPFHQGVKIETNATLQMLKNLKEHLNPQGKAYIVSNTFLDYAGKLQNMVSMKVVKNTSRFIVHVIEN